MPDDSVPERVPFRQRLRRLPLRQLGVIAVIVGATTLVLLIKREVTGAIAGPPRLLWLAAAAVVLVGGTAISKSRPLWRRSLPALLAALFIAWHAWIGPCGYELAEAVDDIQVPGNYSRMHESHSTGMPICFYDCPQAEATYIIEAADVLAVRDMMQGGLEHQGWAVTFAMNYDNGTFDEPCSKNCHMEFTKRGLDLILTIHPSPSDPQAVTVNAWMIAQE